MPPAAMQSSVFIAISVSPRRNSSSSADAGGNSGAGPRDDGVHVARVEIRPLLAVDLDADETLVHHRGRRLVLERLVLHHVAPVARGVTDREQDRLVFFPRARERLLAPLVPVDRVVRMLEQVRAGCLGQAIHACTVLPWLFRAGPSPSCSPTSRARQLSCNGSATTTRRSSRTTDASCARFSRR